jgi:hypothetical protein
MDTPDQRVMPVDILAVLALKDQKVTLADTQAVKEILDTQVVEDELVMMVVVDWGILDQLVRQDRVVLKGQKVMRVDIPVLQVRLPVPKVRGAIPGV